jgi:hypothetical protein
VISYSLNLFLRVYEVASLISVSIEEVNVTNEPIGSSFVSIQTTINITNPTDLKLKIESVWERLYLNNWGNFLGENYWKAKNIYSALPLNPFSNATIIIKIMNVNKEMVEGTSPKNWYAEFIIWIYDIPIVGGARFIRYSNMSDRT